jgi:hypothetical protein
MDGLPDPETYRYNLPPFELPDLYQLPPEKFKKHMDPIAEGTPVQDYWPDLLNDIVGRVESASDAIDSLVESDSPEALFVHRANELDRYAWLCLSPNPQARFPKLTKEALDRLAALSPVQRFLDVSLFMPAIGYQVAESRIVHHRGFEPRSMEALARATKGEDQIWESYRLTEKVITDSIFAVLWNEFFWALEKGLYLVRCRTCGHPVLVNEKRRTFCLVHTAPPGTEKKDRDAYERTRERTGVSWEEWRKKHDSRSR